MGILLLLLVVGRKLLLLMGDAEGFRHIKINAQLLGNSRVAGKTCQSKATNQCKVKDSDWRLWPESLLVCPVQIVG